MSELKRCPFCGGEAEFFEGSSWDKFFVGCTKCFCRTSIFATEKSARLIWNNRKPMKDIVERLEEAKENFHGGTLQEHYYRTAIEDAIKIVKGEV